MGAYIARRLTQGLAVIALVVTATFVLIRLAPGDPFAATLDSPTVSAETRARWSAQYGFDRPVPVQFARYLATIVQGDFGYSTSQRRPVGDVLADALPNTLLLMLVAVVLSFALGIAIGVFQAVRRGSAHDRILGGVSLFFYSMPEFWLASLLLILFAQHLGALPAGGFEDVMYAQLPFTDRVADRVRHLLLPVVTLTLLSAAAVARYQRTAVLDVAGRDYVRTARAKGVDEGRVLRRHVLRNALLPVITLFGLAFPALLGGAIFVENVFSIPGMGQLTVAAISARDYAVVLAAVIVGALMVVLGNLLADLAAAAVDPRLRAE